jgi:hypothetical protein
VDHAAHEKQSDRNDGERVRQILIVNEERLIVDAPDVRLACGRTRDGHQLGIVDLGNHVVLLLISASKIKLGDSD